MKYRLLSFDLQGTLSGSAFSDEFWLETLPALYADNERISIVEAKEKLGREFAQFGTYDERYYSAAYWLKRLDVRATFSELVGRMRHQPHCFPDGIEFVARISKEIPVIITSSTTREFIALEIGGARQYIVAAYSSLDDFGIPGKPPALYAAIAARHGVRTEDILHVGDSREMDIENAMRAGCATFYFDKKIPRKQLFAELNKYLL